MWRGELVHSNNGETDVPVAIYGLHCCPRKYSELRPVERTGRISHGKTSLVGGYCMNLQRISGFLYWFYLICRFRCQKSQRFRSKHVCQKNMNIKTRMEAYAANTWQPTYQSIWWYIPVFFFPLHLCGLGRYTWRHNMAHRDTLHNGRFTVLVIRL
jgi:hypothetical protein